MNNNDKISQWMGRPCTCEKSYDLMGGESITTYWGDCAMHGLGGLSIPWETSERRAIELLSVLADRGHVPCLYHRLGIWVCNVNQNTDKPFGLGMKPTIAQAICDAVLSIIGKEAESI